MLVSTSHVSRVCLHVRMYVYAPATCTYFRTCCHHRRHSSRRVDADLMITLVILRLGRFQQVVWSVGSDGGACPWWCALRGRERVLRYLDVFLPRNSVTTGDREGELLNYKPSLPLSDFAFVRRCQIANARQSVLPP